MLKTRLLQSAAVLAIGALALTGCTNKNASGSEGTANTGTTTVAFVPKLQGIPYFEAMNAGGKKAAEELGIKWLYQGPTTADAAAQADIVRSFIQQKVNTLIVAPNDPDSMAPLQLLSPYSVILTLTCAGNGMPDTVAVAVTFVVAAGTAGAQVRLVTGRPSTLTTAPQEVAGMLVAVPSTSTRQA